MFRIKLFLAKLTRKIGWLNASLWLTESAQKSLKKSIDKLKAELENATQEPK